MAIPGGLDRTFGPAGQQEIHRLRQRGIVALSEVVDPVTAAAVVRTITIVRRQIAVAGSSSVRVPDTWVEVAGLEDLVGYVRTAGRWFRRGEDRAVELRPGERIVTIADIPATGAGDTAIPEAVLTTDDRIRYDDPIYGEVTFEVVETRPRVGAFLCTALVRYEKARED